MGVGSFLKSDLKMVFFGAFSKMLYYGSAVDYHVLSSFARRTRWNRPFSPIRVSTPAKARLKVGSVHAVYKYRILWHALCERGAAGSAVGRRAGGRVFEPPAGSPFAKTFCGVEFCKRVTFRRNVRVY